MTRLALVCILVTVALLLSGCSAQGAPGLLSVTAITGGTHTFAAGERIPGDAYVLAGKLTVEQGASLGGSLLVLGGEVDVAGRIEGDVSLIGGRLRVEPAAQIRGALTDAGGELALAPEATVTGGVRRGEPLPAAAPSPAVTLPATLLSALLPALAVALFAWLLARALPRPFARVTDAVSDHAVVCAAMGLLAGITALVLLVLVAFTVLLIPFSIAGALGLFAAIGYGWAAVGAALGRRLRARWPRLSPANAAALGAFLFTLAFGLVRFVPLVRLVVPPLAAAIALGAVILTRFGATTFVPARDAAPDVIVE